MNTTTINPNATNNGYDQSFVTEANSHQATPSENEVNRVSKLSQLLRIFGACAVIASLSLFLLEGWSDGDDLVRYLKLLAQTGLLTGAGIFLSFVIKEVKGARVFFGLGTISTVANFTILGALTYSMFQLDGGLVEYSDMLKWSAVSLESFLPIAVGAVALLSLLARFSFSIFARNVSGTLTLSFLALNSLLIIPVRGTLWVSIVAAFALLAATQITLSLIKRDDTVMTPEAKFAFASLFLPGLIIVTRALSLYSVTETLLLTLCLLAYYALRSGSILLEKTHAMRKLLAGMQYVLSYLAGLLVVQILPASLNHANMLVISTIVLLATFDQIKLSSGAKWASTMMNASAYLLVIMNVLAAIAEPALLVQFGALAVSIAVFFTVKALSSQLDNTRSAQLVALLGAALSSLLILFHLIALVELSNWVLISGLGMLLILAASFYERFGLDLHKLKRSQPQLHSSQHEA